MSKPLKIAVVGGGPGGLYLALLTKKARPDWQIDVYEQIALTTRSALVLCSPMRRSRSF